MTVTNISKIEKDAIERKTDHRDAKRILAVLNRICRNNKIGRHYEFKNVRPEGYIIKCSYNRTESLNMGLQSVTHFCITEPGLCEHLSNELRKYGL